MLYGHGDDAYRQEQAIVANFSTNVLHGQGPEGLKEHLQSNWASIRTYPGSLTEQLARQIARHHQTSKNQVLVLNGAEEGIHLLAEIFTEAKTTIFIPTFSEYEDTCRLHGHQLGFIPWKTMNEMPKDTELAFLCNPNNPTGDALSCQKLDDLLRRHPGTHFVIDEAFIDFTEAIASGSSILHLHSNLILLKSLTKNFAIPGLRLGYVLAHPLLIKKLKQYQPPYTLNFLALEAGRYIFENYERFKVPICPILKEKKRFLAQLKKLKNFSWHPSHTHFFLGETHQGTAQALKTYLVQEHQLLIRNADNFRGLHEQAFRVATLSRDKNQGLVEALAQWKPGQD